MALPPLISMVTIGVRDLPRTADFYRRLGWVEGPHTTDSYVSFACGGVRLALFPLDRLRDEAAPGSALPPASWNGVTFAVNVASREAVEDAYAAALNAGATAIAPPVAREWGGYSGYIADPEGTRWEIAWAP